MSATIHTIFAVLLLTTIVGCISVPTEEGFREMQQLATSSLDGIQPLRRKPHDDDSTPDLVKSMLTDGLNADQAVQIALAHNRRIQVQYASLDRAATKRLASRLLNNPEVDGSVIISQDDSSEEVIELGVEFDVLRLILLPKRWRIGNDEYSATHVDVAGAVQSLAYDTRVAYFRVLAAQQQHALRQEVFKAAQAGFAMAERLRDAGNIKQLDKLNRQALQAQAQLGVSEAQLAVIEAREDLNVLMGLKGPSATTWQVASTLPEMASDDLSHDSVETDAIQNSMQLSALRHRIEGAAARLGITRIESVLPAVHLGVDAERESDGEWLVGPMIAVEIPLFDFGQAARPAAAAALRQLQHEYAALTIEIGAAARKAAARVATSAQRVKRYRDELVPLREDITHHTQLQYNAMQLGVFQLLQTKQIEIGTQAAYIDELLRYLIASIELKQIRNGLLVKSSRMKSPGMNLPLTSSGNGGH